MVTITTTVGGCTMRALASRAVTPRAAVTAADSPAVVAAAFGTDAGAGAQTPVANPSLSGPPLTA